MKFPKWAPEELVGLHQELKPKADAEEKRRQAYLKQKHPEIDWKTYLEQEDDLYIGRVFLGDLAQFRILEAMITKPIMEGVWNNILKRRASYKFVFRSFYAGKTQAKNLYGACVQAEMNWVNTPKRTRAESKRLHNDIAATALKLCELLLEAQQARDLLDTRKYFDEERYKAFMNALEEDGHVLWYGFDGYLDHLLGDVVPPVPKILLMLHKRALEHVNYPYAVRQPNSPNAKLNFFIGELYEYFNKAYGQPLYAHIAGIVSALFDDDVDEDRVRALIRSRRAASKAYARKKIAEIKEKPPG